MRRLAFAVTIALAGGVAPADHDEIIPFPKEFREVGDPVALTGFRIVTDASERAGIAAGEINQRISSLGGRPLPVGKLEAKLPDGNAIVIATCTGRLPALRRPGLRVAPGDPGRQGYVIQSIREGGGRKLLLVGCDTLGTLYAAVTARGLIVRRGGRLLLQPASVRDAPDFTYRQHGMPFAEHLRGDWYGILQAERAGDLPKARKLAAGYVALQKRYYDWMLRAKINLAWHPINYKPGDMPAHTTVAAEALREIHDYGLARGIEAMAGDTTAIGSHPRDEDNPDFKHVVRHRSHSRYFCWSRLDYHRRRARRAAEWLQKAAYKGYYLHATDGGGWQDPELWLGRCHLCRKTYGDDRAKADAVVFGIYYRAIKQRIPDLKFVAVVYPYTGRYLDPNYVYEQAAAQMGTGGAARKVAQQTTDKLTRFLHRLDVLLPSDVFVCIRESDRLHFDLARAAWGKRRFQLYYEYAFWKGWRPLFLTTPLWTQTFHDPSRDDILHSPSGKSWSEVTLLLGAECSWNVHRPGSRPFDTRRWLAIGTTLPPPPQRETFAQRACRSLFGNRAGPLVAPLFAENLSFLFIAQPQEVMRRAHIDDPAEAMFEQARAAARAAASLEKLRRIQQDENVLFGDRHGYFLNLYRLAQAAPILANHRGHVLAARAAIQNGDRAAVEKHLSAARKHLAEAEPRWKAARKASPPEQLFRKYVRKTSVDGMLHHLDVAVLRQEVENLWRRREALIAAHTIPPWFERSCRTREVVAAPAAGPIRINAKLDEPGWNEATPVQHFVDYRVLRVEGLETRARLLYDDKHLYAAFECFDPSPSGIAHVMSARDEYRLCDSVEVLLARRGESKEFAHWIVDSRGTVFDARAARLGDRRIEYSQKWNSAADVAVRRTADRWTVEMAIPAGEIGVRPTAGRTCKALLCRSIVHTRPEGESEKNAIVFLEGSGFRTPAKFASLRFGRAGEKRPAPQVGLTLQPMSMRHVTTGDGSGTRIDGDLRIETDTYLHDVRVGVRFSDGVQPIGERALGTAGLVRLLWRPPRGLFHLFRTELPGVVCTFEVAAREGRWTFVRRYGSPRRPAVGAETLYAPGIDGKPRSALAAPVFFASDAPRAIRLDEGTIEFWVRPNWDAATRPGGPRGPLEHTFFNMGPVRPDYPYLSNRDSLTIAHHANGHLVCQLSNAQYESRSVSADIRQWRKGCWHHVAVQWKLDDGDKTAMAVFLDGKLASDRCRSNREASPGRPLKVRQLPLPIQVGSMNTGYRPAGAAIDELRISSVRRYVRAFKPPERLDADARTLTLFHFDGALEAGVPAGRKATPGPAQ